MRATQSDSSLANTVRVALLGLSPMMRAIVNGMLEPQPDIVVAPEERNVPDIAVRDADVIVTMADDPSDRVLPKRLLGFLDHRVIVVDPHGRNAVLHEPQLTATHLLDVEPAQLLAAIRHGRPSPLH